MENKMTIATVERTADSAEMIEMPASTPWPIILAFGLALVFAGLSRVGP